MEQINRAYGGDGQYPCSVCGKVYTSLGDLTVRKLFVDLLLLPCEIHRVFVFVFSLLVLEI